MNADSFLPRKPAGKVLLLLEQNAITIDGYSIHCNSVIMLKFASKNSIILISMPSHTSHYQQPLDVAVFKSLKTHFYKSCRQWMKQHPGRRLSRLQFGFLLNQDWVKAATCEHDISGFRAAEVPLNPGAIPEFAFSGNIEAPVENNENDHAVIITQQKTPLKQPGPPNIKISTPTAVLNEISPLHKKLIEVRIRAKQVSILLTSEEHKEKRKLKGNKRLKERRILKKQKIIKQEKSLFDLQKISLLRNVNPFVESQIAVAKKFPCLFLTLLEVLIRNIKRQKLRR